jgi:LPXTG-motif cell wall-anchored protein
LGGERALIINKKNPLKLLFILSIIPVFMLFFYQTNSIEATEKPITLLPESRLFTISNMAPGDTDSKSLSIINNSETDFQYKLTTKHATGSLPLFNDLMVKVSNNGEIVFKGKLKDLIFANTRDLKKGEKDILTFNIEMPINLGNEYQGLTTVVDFIFSAVGDIEPPGNEDNPNGDDTNNPPIKDKGSLPKTGEENPIFIIMSGLFISMAGLALLLIKKSILPNPFKRG